MKNIILDIKELSPRFHFRHKGFGRPVVPEVSTPKSAKRHAFICYNTSQFLNILWIHLVMAYHRNITGIQSPNHCTSCSTNDWLWIKATICFGDSLVWATFTIRLVSLIFMDKIASYKSPYVYFYHLQLRAILWGSNSLYCRKRSIIVILHSFHN